MIGLILPTPIVMMTSASTIYSSSLKYDHDKMNYSRSEYHICLVNNYLKLKYHFNGVKFEMFTCLFQWNEASMDDDKLLSPPQRAKAKKHVNKEYTMSAGGSRN
jgi:hypothetical protein